MSFLYALLSFFSRTANLVAFVLLIISVAAAYVNPDLLWPLSLFGLAYPVFLLLNIFFVISWILRGRWFFLFSLLGILLSYPQLKAQYGFNFFASDDDVTPDLRVMSYNVRNFDLYNWSKNERSRKSMMDTIQATNPDVLFLQEYYTDGNKFKNKQYLDSLGYKYHVEAIELVKKETRKWGVALFSKHPILESGELIRQQLPSPYGEFPNRGVYADIHINGKTIRFITVHLQSIHFGEEDYNTIQEIKEEQPSQIRKYLPIAQKLVRAYMQRGVQAAELRTFIEASPHPVILGGDFNDTPSSFTYRQIDEILTDAFIQKGKGTGSTYNGIIPFLRIDYIFIDPSFRATYFKVNSIPASDHFPLVADISLSNVKEE